MVAIKVAIDSSVRKIVPSQFEYCRYRAASFLKLESLIVGHYKKCQTWFYLRLVAYGFFRLSEGYIVVVVAANQGCADKLN